MFKTFIEQTQDVKCQTMDRASKQLLAVLRGHLLLRLPLLLSLFCPRLEPGRNLIATIKLATIIFQVGQRKFFNGFKREARQKRDKPGGKKEREGEREKIRNEMKGK